MPFSTYSILYPPYIAVTITAPVDNITFIKKGYNTGTVDTVNYLFGKASIGDLCLFKQEDAILVTAGGTDYYLVTEDNVFIQETTPP